MKKIMFKKELVFGLRDFQSCKEQIILKSQNQNIFAKAKNAKGKRLAGVRVSKELMEGKKDEPKQEVKLFLGLLKLLPNNTVRFCLKKKGKIT